MIFNYKKNRAWADSLHIIMQIGLTMAGCIVLCLFIGRFLDKTLGFRGLFTTVFILFGVLGGANVVYRQIMQITEKDKIKSNDKNEV